MTWVVAREVDRPHGAGAHRLADHRCHPVQILFTGAVLEPTSAHHVHAQRGVSDIYAVIDGFREPFDGGQIFGESLPGPVDPSHHRRGRNVFDRRQAPREPLPVPGPTWREGKSAIARHDAGHAMPTRAAAQRVPRDLRVHMSVIVDKARRDDKPAGVDRALGGGADASDLNYAPALDSDIRAISRHT